MYRKHDLLTKMKIIPKEINDIIVEIEKERNLFKNFIFNFKDKVPIFKKWLEDIRDWMEKKEQVDFHIGHERLLIIISESYLSPRLKIDSFISDYHNSKGKLLANNSEFSRFINKFVKAFESVNEKDVDFIEKLRCFSEFLINVTKIKLKKQPSYDLVKVYLSLLKLMFLLLKSNNLCKERYLHFFSIFDKIPIKYDLIRKYELLINYYIKIENNLDNIKGLVFNFFQIHKRREIYFIDFPDPMQFCNYIEKRFRTRSNDFIFNIYFEYYQQHTTNFIPPLFLGKKYLNDSKVLEIIYRNLVSENFIDRDLEVFFENIIKIKPKKENFDLYCKTISRLRSQIFIFNFYKIYKTKNLSLFEKFTLISSIVSSISNFYRYKNHPQTYLFLISKRKYLKNGDNLKAYFRLVLTVENYSDFKKFYLWLFKERSVFNKRLLKIFRNSRKKLRKKVEEILGFEEFALLKHLLNIFENNFYNIYKLNNYRSLDEYIVKELNSNSKQLKIFLYEQFISVANKPEDEDSITSRKLYLEFQNFCNTITDDDKNIYDLIYDFCRNSHKENYTIEINHLYTLIKSRDKKALFDFINDRIKNEENKELKVFEKLGILYFLKGDMHNSYNSIDKAIIDYTKDNIYKKNSINLENKVKELTNFKKIIGIEKNIRKYGQIVDFLKDLKQPLIYLKNFNHFIGYFINFEIYKHYYNIWHFLLLVHDFEKKIFKNKEELLFLLDFLYSDSSLCAEWEDIKKLWERIIDSKPDKKNVLIFAEEQYSIFNKNPLFKGIKDFLEMIQKPESNLYLLFNYDPGNLIKDFKEKFQRVNFLFNMRYHNEFFMSLTLEDNDLFNALHIPFDNSHEKLDTFLLTLDKATKESINVKFLRSKIKLTEEKKGLLSLNLLEKFIGEEFCDGNENIKKIMYGFKELNSIRSGCGIAHKRGSKCKKILRKYSLQHLDNIELSKRIVSDLTNSLNRLSEILEFKK